MITVKRTSNVIDEDNKLPETVTEVIENDNLIENKPKLKKGRKKKDVNI